MPDLKADVSRRLHGAPSYMRGEMWSNPLGALKHPGLAESALVILKVIVLVLT